MNQNGRLCIFTTDLFPADIPNPPAGKPVVSQVTKESLVLSWSGPNYDGGSPITNYRVEMSKAGLDKWKVLTSNCKVTIKGGVSHPSGAGLSEFGISVDVSIRVWFSKVALSATFRFNKLRVSRI